MNENKSKSSSGIALSTIRRMWNWCMFFFCIGALSSSKKDRGKGALIGAAAGAALGGGVGYYMDVQEAKLRDKMRGTG
ncbi:glycine zipper domain-containing protein, partial [Brevibacillus laterosporus]|uniref:glycine zipper domain-containing protein n=1 Tax=Brevibacillus laterosporus TaxID=1465 RepID=UPI001C3E0C49